MTQILDNKHQINNKLMLMKYHRERKVKTQYLKFTEFKISNIKTIKGLNKVQRLQLRLKNKHTAQTSLKIFRIKTKVLVLMANFNFLLLIPENQRINRLKLYKNCKSHR